MYIRYVLTLHSNMISQALFIKRYNEKTGNGPCPLHLTEVEEVVVDVLGATAIYGKYGSYTVHLNTVAVRCNGNVTLFTGYGLPLWRLYCNGQSLNIFNQ